MHQKIQIIKELKFNIDHNLELIVKVKHIQYNIVLLREVISYLFVFFEQAKMKLYTK